MDKLEDRLTNEISYRYDKTQDMLGKQISLAYPTLTRSDIEKMVKPIEWNSVQDCIEILNKNIVQGDFLKNELPTL